MMPPLVSMPRDSGVTSMSSTSLRSPLSTPACRAAPTATTSSGLTPLLGSLPPVSFLTSSATAGMRVEPPTSTTWAMSATLMPASLMTSLERLLGALEQVAGHLLELRAGERLVEVDRAVLGQREVLQRDVGAGGAGQLLLGLLGRLLQALHGDLVLGQVDAGGVLELLDQVVDDPLVPVVAAEAVVTGGGAHLDGGEVVLVLAHLEQGDVEGAATEVEDEDELVLLALVEAVGERGGGRLVDDAQHVEAGDLAGLLGGLALGVVEVRRDGDDGVGDRLAQVLLGVALELAEDAGGDLLRRCTSCRRSSTVQSVPMWRLTDAMVRSTLVTAWRLAVSPTSTSPSLVKATTDGVVRKPSALAMTVGSPPSRTATTELVVPRSMPTARAISGCPFHLWTRP